MPERRINLLIKELGLPALKLNDEDTCTISTADGLDIVLNYVDIDDTLVTYADLGRIPDERREPVLEAMLKGNFGWQNTRGATLSTGTHRRQAVLQTSARVDLLDAATLTEHLDHFFRWAGLWKEIIGRSEEETSSAAMD